MDNKAWTQRAGVTRGKLVLVAVLAVVLVTVLVLQLGGSTAGSVTPRRPAKEKKDAGAAPRAAGTSEREAAPKDADRIPAAPRNPWPQVPLEEILEHDPLATPSWLEPPIPVAPQSAKSSESEIDAQRERRLVWERLCGQGVALVLITPDGPVATVGDRRVRVGDLIEGFRVEKIDGQGLVLADPNEGLRN
jgi:hypothetical protein